MQLVPELSVPGGDSKAERQQEKPGPENVLGHSSVPDLSAPGPEEGT